MTEKDMEYAKLCKSMLPKKYSHCPLKKRPVQIYKEDSEFCAQESMDTSEPENLSIKPEDLSVSALRSASPSSGATPEMPNSAAQLGHEFFKTSEKERPLGTAFSVPQKETPKTGNRVLEPLNLNTSLGVSHPVAFRPTPQYPPHHYMPHFGYNYGSHDVYQQYQSSIYSVQSMRIHQDQVSCLERRDEACSPSRLYPSPVRPLPSLARAPAEKFYLGYSRPDACELSPTSSASSSRSSPPPATPEDLSSPGSVASTESVGSAGMGGGKRRKDSGPRYQCPDCNKSYSTYSGLSKHQQFHCSANEASQAKKSFSCKFCEKVYVSLGALKMHIRTHTLPCKCTVCGKAFSRPWLLQGHVRTHTGEKPFSCQHCGRAFADRSNLRAHLQTHSDVKKYSCTTCSKTFSRMSLLTKHSDGGCPGGNSAPQHECLLYQQQPSHLLPEIPLPDKFHR